MFSDFHTHIIIRYFLFSRCQASFLQLYHLHTQSLFQLSMQLTGGDKSVSEGLVIQTWIDATESMQANFFGRSFKKWLSAILVRRCEQHYKKHQRYILIHDDTLERGGVVNLVSKSNHSGEKLCYLSVGHRFVFTLHDLQGYTHRDISDLLKISEGTSRSLLFTARRHVARHLGGTDKLFSSIPIPGLGVRERVFFNLPYGDVKPPAELNTRTLNQLYIKALISPTGFSTFRKITIGLQSIRINFSFTNK